MAMNGAIDYERLIEDDDPLLTELTIGATSYFPGPDDWERAGDMIGRNTKIKSLVLSDNLGGAPIECVRGLFKGIVYSKSITSLVINGEQYNGQTFTMLLPLARRNVIQDLKIIGEYEDDGLRRLQSNYFRRLSQVLCTFSCLREFELSFHQIRDEDSKAIFQALGKHQDLNILILEGNSMEKSGFVALSRLISLPTSQLRVVDLDDNYLHQESLEIVLKAIHRNKTITDLCLDNNTMITSPGWSLLSSLLHESSGFKLKCLSLKCTEMNDRDALFLSNALSSNSCLEILNLENLSNITNTGWRNIFSAFRTNSTLQDVHLGDNFRRVCRFNDGLPDAGLFLSDALHSNSTLRVLDLEGCNLTVEGVASFGTVLQKPDCALQRLDMQGVAVDYKTALTLVQSTTTNRMLTDLLLHHTGWLQSCTREQVDQFNQVLCNPSTIMATYNSNHTLCNVGHWCSEINGIGDLARNLFLNGKSNKRDVARQKIIYAHFGNNAKLHHFCRLDLALLPHAISWVGKEYGSLDTNDEIDMEDELNKSCLHYRLIRSLPVLFDLRSLVKSNKRKRTSSLDYEFDTHVFLPLIN